MSPKKTKPSKLPPRVVPSDSLVIEVDGVEYRPHAGETVSVRGGVTVGDYLFAVKLRDFSADSDPVERTRFWKDTIANLCGRIVAWTWTDDAGNPYPSPPTAEVLEALLFAELSWLLDAAGTATNAAIPKNS